MKARGVKRLEAEVDAWAAETRIFLGACRRLIEYFGTARELKRYDPPFSPIRSPMPRSTLGSECPKISRIGCSAIC